MQLTFQRRFHLLFLFLEIKKPNAALIVLICNESVPPSFLFLVSPRRSYHGYKTLKDFVRRRRWSRYYETLLRHTCVCTGEIYMYIHTCMSVYSNLLVKGSQIGGPCEHLCVSLLHRKSKLTTTGPWQEIPPISLIDVSLLPCAAPSGVDVVPLWAISNKGDVLCRLGVTALTPAVSHVCCTIRPPPSTHVTVLTSTRCSLRDPRGSTWEPTSLSSLSPWGGPARCGPSLRTALPFTEDPSRHRAPRVSRTNLLSKLKTEATFTYQVLCPPLQETAGTTSPPQPDRS